jgi:hypothetical protein
MCAGGALAATAGLSTVSAQQVRSGLSLRPAPQGTFISGSDTGGLLTVNNTGTTALSSAGVMGLMTGGPYGIGLLGVGYNAAAANIGVLGLDIGPGGYGAYAYQSYPEPAGGPTLATETVGAVGFAANGDGLIGETTVNHSTTPGTIAGVAGEDLGTNGAPNDGVLGTTSGGGYGVDGVSGTNALGGVRGYATSGDGGDFYSHTHTGVYGSTLYGSGGFFYAFSGSGVTAQLDATTPGAFPQTGVMGSSNSSVGVGVWGGSSNGGTGYEGVYGQADFIGLVGQLTNAGVVSGHYALATLSSPGEGGAVTFSVDDAGNVNTPGTITHAVASRNGLVGETFTSHTMSQTIEDTGTASLARGAGTVKLDAAFAQLINDANYQVFLTPNGDSRGLYVTGKSLTSFAVRENQGGASTLSFDYRIVAHVNGHASDRVALVARPKVLGMKRGLSAPLVVRPHSQTMKDAKASLVPDAIFVPRATSALQVRR